MVKIYSCEGNIGAGKTTFLSQIEIMCKLIYKDKYKIVVLREPVDIWETIKDAEGQNILENFYKDPIKYAFPFQVLAFTTRLDLLKKTINENPDCDIIICERSLYADGNIFAKMLYDDGNMDHLSYQIYRKMYENAITEYPLDRVIYLTIPAEVCAKRIINRGRSGEEHIPLEYLKKCYEYHETWLNNSNLGFGVLRMDEYDVERFVKSENVIDSILTLVN